MFLCWLSNYTSVHWWKWDVEVHNYYYFRGYLSFYRPHLFYILGWSGIASTHIIISSHSRFFSHYMIAGYFYKIFSAQICFISYDYSYSCSPLVSIYVDVFSIPLFQFMCVFTDKVNFLYLGLAIFLFSQFISFHPKVFSGVWNVLNFFLFSLIIVIWWLSVVKWFGSLLFIICVCTLIASFTFCLIFT